MDPHRLLQPSIAYELGLVLSLPFVSKLKLEISTVFAQPNLIELIPISRLKPWLFSLTHQLFLVKIET